MRKAQKYGTTIQRNGQVLPVEIIVEQRRNVRFGITTKRKIILRVPFGVTNAFINEKIVELENWVNLQFDTRPDFQAQVLSEKTYKTGDELNVGDRRYFLDLSIENRGTHAAKLVGDTIMLQLSAKSTPANQTKAIKTLLSRIVAGDYYAEIFRRVQDMNDRTFKRGIRSVNLKYNHTNWGSCSSASNINLSTRLLFAPKSVQDYVILHELAHLVEPNHSDRFWALVEQFMPDYVEKENWLKLNRSLCDF